MSAIQKPVEDACTEYRESVCKVIFTILGKGKELRTRLNGLGITSPAGGAGPAIGLVTFPLSGELAFITSQSQLVNMIAALEALETALSTPVDGVVPAAAFASFRG